MILLDGVKLSKKIKVSLQTRIDYLKKNKIVPGLAVILVGDNPESKMYISMKQKACKELGLNSQVYTFPENENEKRILHKIYDLNSDSSIHGILVQLPLPSHIDTDKIVNAVSYLKDVDGFHVFNAGKLFQNKKHLFVPCTPQACLEIIDHYKIEVKGMHVVIIGCSNIVGLPVSMLLLHRGATITLCHIDTENPKEITKQADMIIACCGVPKLVKKDWVKENTIIIDIGINRVVDPTAKKGYQIIGDVDFENVKQKCSHITPVPGGIGPMTIAVLMMQTLKAAEYYQESNEK